MRSVVALSAIVVVVVVLAPLAAAAEEVFEQTYPLSAGGSFRLQNVNGSVVITGWERDAVEIRAVKTARRDRLDLERVRIEVEATPGAVNVATRYPEQTGVDVSVEYRVRVPRRVRLSGVSTVNGAVRVSGVEGTAELHSVNGGVEALDTAGQISARTTNGNVRLELRRLDPGGTSTAETVNGSVEIALPADAGAELDVRSLNGDFRSELPVTVAEVLSPREFQARLGAGGARLSLRTVNGPVRILALRPTV